MSKIRLFSLYTEEFTCFKENFLRTLKDDWSLEIEFCGKAGEGNGDFGSPGFVRVVRQKMEWLSKKIKECSGDILIWADMDIQFFGKCTPLLLKALRNRDIVFQSEAWPKKQINTGFIAMRCNPSTAELFDTVRALDFEAFPFHEQTAIENCLREGKLKIDWDVLPWQFWAPTHSWPPPIDIVTHHATATQPIVRNGQTIGSVALKTEQFALVKTQMEQYAKLPWLASVNKHVRSSLSHRRDLLKYKMGWL